MIPMRDQKQIDIVLNEFNTAVKTVKDKMALKDIQVDFCYTSNEIEHSPDYNIPNLLLQIEALTDKVKKL